MSAIHNLGSHPPSTISLTRRDATEHHPAILLY